MNLNYAGKQSKSVNQNIFTPPCNLVVGIPEHVDVVYLEEKPSCDFIVVTCCDAGELDFWNWLKALIGGKAN